MPQVADESIHAVWAKTNSTMSREEAAKWVVLRMANPIVSVEGMIGSEAAALGDRFLFQQIPPMTSGR